MSKTSAASIAQVNTATPAHIRDAALAQVLADTYALAVKTHAAHWNVAGQGFFELHAAFQAQYTALFTAADDLAERLRALGQPAPAGLSAISAASRIADTATVRGALLCADLAANHVHLSSACRAGVAAAQAAGDEATADLLIGRIEDHDKTAWMLSAWTA